MSDYAEQMELGQDDSDRIGIFVYPGLPPRATEHWATIHKAKTRWAEDFAWQAQYQRMTLAKPGEKRIVEIVLRRPGAAMDVDNLHARMKVPLDVLSRAHGRKKIGLGIIWDDDPAHLILRVSCQRTSPGISETVVIVRSV